MSANITQRNNKENKSIKETSIKQESNTTTNEKNKKISKPLGILIALRPWSLTISATSILLGSALAFKETGKFDTFMFVVTLIGGISVQSFGNVVNSFYDSKRGNDTFEKSADRTMFDLGLCESEIINLIGYLLFQCVVCLGLVIYRLNGDYNLILESLLPMVVFGLLLCIFYTADPVGLKYIGLGDLTIFLCFGPLLVQSSYLLQTRFFDFNIFYYSIPLAMTIVAVLHVNNTRDIEADKSTNSKTIASIVGLKGCFYIFVSLYLISYGSLFVFSYLENKYTMLMPIIVLPKVISLIKEFKNGQLSDAKTAQLSFFFGGLNAIGVLLSSD
ncbi:hypothetical protein DICPUDRAFT_79171 [Dictyostelium purpureum]|uniref:UbiA prenyltransferase family protein n=1 Tax=Dictyostelium purpureum TaxID=5786 RepID=F0ZLS5_DICPU|nr:uncharacterized protein DICPUDRAFT_79171 [Dictyostelium purpureum]EGC35108.1 hypothetical protein DICPUDRAFT_79171 [Dictyostelium purpureum]|eukprot:XP_003288360.1 hypothetical protein DICPUDRAFT_79171 [Dictyostelium purpureum]